MEWLTSWISAFSCYETFCRQIFDILTAQNFFVRPLFLLHLVGTIDRFKKFARLGTSLSISDAIIWISATMRGKRTSDDLAKSIYRCKDANPDYANSAIARIFSISESTLTRILKRRIGRSDRQKKVKKNWNKVKLGQKFVLTRRIKRQLLGRVNRNSKLRLSDLLLTTRRLVSNATAHTVFWKSRHSKSCCCTRRSYECSKR